MVFSRAQLMTRTKGGPIWFFRQPSSFRFGARDDDSVQAFVEQIVGAPVVPAQIVAPPVRARRRLHFVKMQPDEKPPGRLHRAGRTADAR
jgi:hypothetical protein